MLTGWRMCLGGEWERDYGTEVGGGGGIRNETGVKGEEETKIAG